VLFNLCLLRKEKPLGLAADSLLDIDIHLSKDDYFLLKKYFNQYPAPLYDSVQESSIF
jgi:hypothetical protein